MKRLAAPALGLAAALSIAAASTPARAQSAPQPYPYPYPYPYAPPLMMPAPQSSSPSDPLPKRPESNGQRLIQAGAVLLAVSGVNLIGAPVCATNLMRSDLRTPCAVTTLTVASAALVVGMPLLIIGLNARRRFEQWRERYEVGLGVGRGGATLSWSAKF